MNFNNNRPIWMHRQGRFQLSLWRNQNASGTKKERYSFCVQHGYFKDGAWHNRRIWCSVKDLLSLSACLRAFNSLASGKKPTNVFNPGSEKRDPAPFYQKSGQIDLDQRTFLNDAHDDGVPIKILEIIDHIKRCVAKFPELGIWWHRQDVEIDLDAILMSYGLRSNDFDPEERDHLRKQLINLADLERNGGLLSGPYGHDDQPLSTQVTG